MIQIKRLVLDVLKPHQPTVTEFASTIAAQVEGGCVNIKVLEMDDKTETLELIVEGINVNLDNIVSAINDMGGSLHSVDGVQVVNLKEE